MNNNALALLRALIVYAICVPAAIIIGYLLVQAANLPTRSSLATIGFVILGLSAPVWLRWHYPLMLFCWNLPIVIFFLRGNPPLYLLTMPLSLGLSIVQRAMNREMRFLRATPVVLPLLSLAGVALVTARLTGGFGLHVLHSEVMGGKRYIFLLAGIAAFFAVTARRIPPEKATLYLALFFLPGIAAAISDTIGHLPSAFNYIYLFIPPDTRILNEPGMERLAYTTGAALLVFTYLIVRYGVRGIFLSGKRWRPVLLLLTLVVGSVGGFRSFLIYCALLFTVSFFLEGLHRTRLVVGLTFGTVLMAVVLFPFTDRLPWVIQRTLSFLPVHVNPIVRMDAEGSLNWRLQMWQALLPDVPRYFWLGKGYAITESEYAVMSNPQAYRIIDPSQQGLALSSDYHNGPLSVILPFGIWGVLAFVWFLIAAWWAIARNRRYGDPALQTINTGLYAVFIAKVLFFLIFFGDLASDMATLSAYAGLSIAINGGICRRAVPAPATESAEPVQLPLGRPRLQPAFSQQS